MSYGGPLPEQQPKPRVVEIGAALFGLVGIINLARVAYGVLLNLSQDDWERGARTVFLVLNSFFLIYALFLVAIASQVWRGRLWAWITGLAVLPFAILIGGILTLITALGGHFPLAGAAVVITAVAALLTMTVPRQARGYFMRGKAAPPAPWPAPSTY